MKTVKIVAKSITMPANYMVGLMVSGMTFCGVHGFWKGASINRGLYDNPIIRIFGYAVSSTCGYLAGKGVEAAMNRNVDKMFENSKEEKKD